MKKEDLIKLKEKLRELSEQDEKLRNLYLRKISSGELYGSMVGYASIDKPWLGYYPELMFNERKKYNKIIDYIKDTWQGYEKDIIISYYNSNITVKEFFDNVEKTARSLKILGLNKGDTIVTNLESVPEFIYIFFAAETIGVNIKNKIGATIEEMVEVINDGNAKCFMTHDYMSGKDVDVIYNQTQLKNIIMVNPLEYADGDIYSLENHIKENILSKYDSEISKDIRNISWKEFMSLGKDYTDEIYVQSDEFTKLFSAYTSGSTGNRKEVIHSSKTFLEMLYQMIFPLPKPEKRDTWLLPTFPPTLVAIVVAFICMPLAEGKRLILDPYAKIEDIDLEIMHYEPTCIGIVPVFFDVLLDSKRIPDDYDMSYFKIIGFGAEPMTRKYTHKVLEFMKKHNCNANFNAGYGNSEGGSEFTIAFGADMILSGSSGFPLINTTVSVFKQGTEEELSYGEIGELCKSGSGIMLGYSTEEETSKVIKIHSDGKKWLHTGDIGYITKEGFVFVLGREGIKVYSDKIVYGLTIENKVMDLDGIKSAIVVSGDSLKHESYQSPYLFIVKEEDADYNELLVKIEDMLKSVLQEEEYPEQVYFIDNKPIAHFKVDRKLLRKKYNITTENS